MNQRLRRYLSWVLLLLIAIIMASGCTTTPPTSPITGDMTAKQLLVERHRQDDIVAVQINQYIPIQANDRVAVDTTGRALIRFSDRVLVELFRDSKVEIAQVSLEPAGLVFLRLQQTLGHSQIELKSIADVRLTLTTEYATITPITSATKFAVCQAPGVTCTVTLTGETEVQAQGQSRTVRGGEGTFILEGQPPLPPVCIDLNEVRQWMDRLRGPEEFLPLVTLVQGRAEPPCTGNFTATPTLAPTPLPVPPVNPSEPLSPTLTSEGSDPAQAVYVHVPAGEFIMGSDEGNTNEQPVHTVDLDEFSIMQTEVTNAQYAQCMAADACTAPSTERWNDPAFANHPVTGVTWHQANAYATWAGGRLPTEAEWEKAARGTDGRVYPWGDQLPSAQQANFNLMPGDTTPVGAYPAGASPYGVLDMAGNAEEWVADWYGQDYYVTSPARNPQGPAAGTLRVLRGGSFRHNRNDIRAAVRIRALPDSKFDTAGFRVVVSTPQE